MPKIVELLYGTSRTPAQAKWLCCAPPPGVSHAEKPQQITEYLPRLPLCLMPSCPTVSPRETVSEPPTCSVWKSVFQNIMVLSLRCWRQRAEPKARKAPAFSSKWKGLYWAQISREEGAVGLGKESPGDGNSCLDRSLASTPVPAYEPRTFPSPF